MTDAHLAPVQAYLDRLDRLVATGRALREKRGRTPFSQHDDDEKGVRPLFDAWRRDCGVVIGELAGGSKAHWLARAYSEAFLVPNAPDADPTRIIERIVDVLERARLSLAELHRAQPQVRLKPDPTPVSPQQSERQVLGLVSAGSAPQQMSSSTSAGPEARQSWGPALAGPQEASLRFDFVPDAVLRSSLAQASRDAQSAFDRGEFALALVTWCSVLEAVITDALVRRGSVELATADVSPAPFVSWSLSRRIAAAERARLISAGCARLPDIARNYHALLDERGDLKGDVPVDAREARLAGQVVRVIMRDLAPER